MGLKEGVVPAVSFERTVTLICHPSARCPAVRSVDVRISVTPSGDLALAYRLSGDMARLAVPAPQRPGPADGLWQHTCFEAFVAAEGHPAYREFNVSPSGLWAAYAFADYRQRHPWAVSRAPQIAVRRFQERLEMDALVHAALLPPVPAGAGLHLGVTAVVETAEGALSYWALEHPLERPDFHHRDGFAVELPARRSGLPA